MGGGVLKWSLFMFEFEDNFLVLGFGGVVWEGGVFFFFSFYKIIFGYNIDRVIFNFE